MNDENNLPAKTSTDEDPNELLSADEAAEYLGVSRPTIFRWMKQGKLSFHKIGSSTRFSRSALDTFVEKVTGSAEAEAAAGRCASCGQTLLIDGRLQGAGRLYFKPKKTKFWVFEESMVAIGARVCPACGYVQIYADTEKLKRIRANQEDGTE